MSAAPRVARPRLRRVLVWTGRLSVTIGLLGWVLSRADLGAVGTRLREAHLPWIGAAVALAALNICLGALRWRLVLRALGVDLPAAAALRLCWSALFFNTFLPAGVVGDALRGAWAIRASGRSREDAPSDGERRAGASGRARAIVASIVLDRIVAFVALALLIAIGLTLPAARALPARAGLAVAALALGVPAAALYAFPERVARLAVRLGGERARRLLGGDLMVTPAAGPRWAALALAGVLHGLIILVVAALARAASAPVATSALVSVVPAVSITAYVPIAVSGIGVREAAFVELLGQVGVPSGAGLAISVLFLATSWCVSLAGGVIYLTRQNAAGPRPRATVAEAVDGPRQPAL